MANVNELSFNQLSTVLNSIVAQATGKQTIAPTTPAEFVSVAQTALKVGYDPLATAISQVLSKTIFSVRPYTAKFRGLSVDSIVYGNHVRKLQVVDKEFEDDKRLELVDGQSVDPYVVNKPEVLQTNFYGQNVFVKQLTIYRDQLDSAFSGVEEFRQFLGMYIQNAQDLIEQAKENVARQTVINLIGGALAAGNVIHLLDEYNNETGEELTAETVKAPANMEKFAKWYAGFQKTLSARLTERSQLYHVNVTGKPISRHTPLEMQKIYLYAPFFNNISASVYSSVFNEEYIKIADYEGVNFWQSITAPERVEATISVLNDEGQIDKNTVEVTSGLLGVIFDQEAAGVTTVNEYTLNTPMNARGSYYNTFYHFTERWWNDFTENAVVLMLDTEDEPGYTVTPAN